jgi:hypothetical protein
MRETIRTLVLVAIPVAAILASATSPAATEPLGCRLLPGTYVTTITDIEGVFASRGIVTFTPEGGLLATDSRQGGQTGVYDPFSAGQGAWSCAAGEDGNIAFSALSLTFTTPPGSAGSNFGRVDYEGTLDTASGEISGTVSLRFSEAGDLEAADPIAAAGEVFETFSFEGQRVVAPKP